MGSDEEYLDNLLKSLIGGEEGSGDEMSADELKEAAGVDINKALADLNLAGDQELAGDLDLAIEDHGQGDDFVLNDFAIEDLNPEGHTVPAGEAADEGDLTFTHGIEEASLACMEDNSGELSESRTETAGPSADDMLALLGSISGEEQEEQEQNIVTADEAGTETGKKPKKPGLFARMFAFLTETDEGAEEELQPGIVPSDENKDVLKQLKEEDKKKKKKKIKGKKAQTPELSEEAEDLEENSAGTKRRKKEKKEKQQPAPGYFESERPGKRVSKKNVAVIAGVCLTFTAVIVVSCSIVPGFFDKREARIAYYESDYAKSYDLLYGKRLDSSDTIIFNKSRIILELNRELDSYHNYLGVNQEVYALDALMSGVRKYPDLLLEAEEYHIGQEVSAIYDSILNILSDKYDISESVAKVILSYDDLTYTKKLESVVHGTPFVMPGEEEEMASASTDLLPEEQIFLEEETVQTGGSAGEAVEHTYTPEEEAELPVENAELPAEEAEVTDEQPESPVGEAVPLPMQEAPAGVQGELIQGVRQPIEIQINTN